MALINNVNEVLHRIRVKLYPNYLPHVEGAYIARTDSEASLSIEQVCAALKNRGGFTGNYDDLVEDVRQFFDEAAYQLCDGFSVNTGYFSIHPNVGGTFNAVNEAHDKEKHPIGFRFRTLAALRTLAEHIAVEVEGLAEVQGYIDEFIDISTGALNETATPGGLFKISGHKIKVAGEDPACGVYFVSPGENPQEVKVGGHLAENAASKVIGIIPSLSPGVWKGVIKTQFSGSGSTSLKAPRIIESSFTLTVA
ncbi:MAG: DUF4469 domain-containing protein [Treponema sp.]|jgi:hypothetical protein|nr:DUF4469 domain-containing protein [Treponema sp.]